MIEVRDETKLLISMFRDDCRGCTLSTSDMSKNRTNKMTSQDTPQDQGQEQKSREQESLCGYSALEEYVNPLEEEVLREVHHRVKNNLQVVCSLLRIQGREILDSSLREILKRSEERIQTMALVYDNLCKANGCDLVPLDKYLNDITKQLLGAAQRGPESLRLSTDLQSAYVSSQAATSIGLLINELISGWLRQSVSVPDRLFEVTLLNDGIMAHIEIRDSGKSAGALFSLSPIGQQILDALVLQVRGKITYVNDEGIVFRLEFPIENRYSKIEGSRDVSDRA